MIRQGQNLGPLRLDWPPFPRRASGIVEACRRGELAFRSDGSASASNCRQATPVGGITHGCPTLNPPPESASFPHAAYFKSESLRADAAGAMGWRWWEESDVGGKGERGPRRNRGPLLPRTFRAQGSRAAAAFSDSSTQPSPHPSPTHMGANKPESIQVVMRCFGPRSLSRTARCSVRAGKRRQTQSSSTPPMGGGTKRCHNLVKSEVLVAMERLEGGAVAQTTRPILRARDRLDKEASNERQTDQILDASPRRMS